MTSETISYTESLTADESAFLQEQSYRALKTIYRVSGYCMFISFIAPFAGAWVKAFRDEPEAFSPLRYYMGVAYLLLVTAGIARFMYVRSLRPLRRDIKSSEKTVEETTILRRVFMPHNGTCHFYLQSRITDSIEVDARTYQHLREGDAINIVFAPHSKTYLGYF